MLRSSRSFVLAVGGALVLADGSIVTLALPQLLHDLHVGVVAVAAVLFVYMAVLGACALAAAAVIARSSARSAAAAGFALVAAGGLICAVAGSLAVLLAGRILAAAGGGVALVAAFRLIDGSGRGVRSWTRASVLGLAVGPALGGALTQALDWRAIFVLQIPVALLAALGAVAGRSEAAREPASGSAAPSAPAAARAPAPAVSGAVRAAAWIALGLISAALSAVLFLLVLLMIAGWSLTPLAAAATVTALPVGTLAGARVPGTPVLRAALGSALVGAGVLALAWVPQPDAAWTIAPQLLAGAGAGAALPALAGELIPQRTVREVGLGLGVRHLAVAVLLVALAPQMSSRLTSSVDHAQLQGIAVVLGAPLSPQAKLKLAPQLLNAVNSQRPRHSLHVALARHRADFSGDDLVAYDTLGRRIDGVLTGAVKRAFQPAFLIAGGLALLGALLLLVASRRAAPAGVEPGPGAAGAGAAGGGSVARRRLLAALAALAVAVPVVSLVAQSALAPAPVTLADPCDGAGLPHSGGFSGFLQDRGIQLLDLAACKLHTSREELVLALASQSESDRFAKTHDGVNPRNLIKPVSGLLKTVTGLLHSL